MINLFAETSAIYAETLHFQSQNKNNICQRDVKNVTSCSSIYNS